MLNVPPPCKSCLRYWLSKVPYKMIFEGFITFFDKLFLLRPCVILQRVGKIDFIGAFSFCCISLKEVDGNATRVNGSPCSCKDAKFSQLELSLDNGVFLIMLTKQTLFLRNPENLDCPTTYQKVR